MTYTGARPTLVLKDSVAPRFTILLPVIRPPCFLPNAIESVLAQTVSEFELFVICDGAPAETIECAHKFARRDPRVTVCAFLKGERNGEAHFDTVLTNASGTFVAYLEDDDLWLPNHLAELEKLLQSVDFGHTINVRAHPDGHVEAFPCDLGKPDFRQRFLDDLFNRFGYTFCGHRLDAYRRLPEGWVPTPVGMFPDLHMWRKFFRMSEFKFGTRMVITGVTLPGHLREHMSLEERAREAGVWLSRIVDEHERANIVEAAWHSVVAQGIQCEQEIIKINSSNREAKAAVAQMEAMHPGSLRKLGRAIEAQANAELEIGRLSDVFHLSQHALSVMTAKAEEQEAAIAVYQTDLARLNGTLAEREAALSIMAVKSEEREVAIAAYQADLAQLNGTLAERETSLSVTTAKVEEQEAAIAAYQADLAQLNGTLAEWKTAYEDVVHSRSWRLTQPLRSAVAAARRLGQKLRRD
ncbi:MAG TPA: glycosyltransferase [Pyrinomonadaceae bacterium]